MALKSSVSTPTTQATAVRRRRRRTVTTNYVTLAKSIMDSMLSSGSASQKDMEVVLGWVRSVAVEAEALKELVKRPRRAKAEGAGDRIAKLELNKALLQGLLTGDFIVGVDENADITFARKAK
jgi:hypothetical protein